MRNRFLFPLVILLLLSLTACGKVGSAEDAISAIGTVTMDSESTIAAAEALFSQLNSKQQSRVENREALTAAREEFTRLSNEVENTVAAIGKLENITLSERSALEQAEALFAALREDQKRCIPNTDILIAARAEFDRQESIVSKAVDRIENLGEITLASMDALSSARQAYQRAVNEGLSVYVQHVYDILTEAEKRYEYLGLERRLNAAKGLYSEGNYTAALNQATVLIDDCQGTDLVSVAKTLAADSIVALARESLEADDLENAYNRMRASDELYPTQERPEAYILLQEDLTAALKKCRPANGKVLKSRQAYDPYDIRHEVIVQAPDDYDVCVKLERVGDANKYVMFYVRAGEKATIGVYHGNYNIKYAMGEHWFGIDSLFGEQGVYVQADDPFEFYTYLQGNYKYYVGLSLTIGYALDGETDGQEISREKF